MLNVVYFTALLVTSSLDDQVLGISRVGPVLVSRRDSGIRSLQDGIRARSSREVNQLTGK